MTHQCYYCSMVFKSREELYKHVATHAKTGNDDSKKTDNNRPKIEIKDDNENKERLTNRQSGIDQIKKKIEELQERIESHATKNQ